MFRRVARVATTRAVAPLCRSAAPLVPLTAVPAGCVASSWRACSTAPPPTAPHPSGLPKELCDDLAALIAKDRMVVFLTGTPEQPRCGFTGRLVDILSQFGASYSFVDIMESDEICEGLKEYSSWPTYPQIYIDGELLGGYDIARQMAVDGSLAKLLADKDLLEKDE
jgi:Grx4 family monothiol glutaredoxin